MLPGIVLSAHLVLAGLTIWSLGAFLRAWIRSLWLWLCPNTLTRGRMVVRFPMRLLSWAGVFPRITGGAWERGVGGGCGVTSTLFNQPSLVHPVHVPRLRFASRRRAHRGRTEVVRTAFQRQPAPRPQLLATPPKPAARPPSSPEKPRPPQAHLYVRVAVSAETREFVTPSPTRATKTVLGESSSPSYGVATTNIAPD